MLTFPVSHKQWLTSSRSGLSDSPGMSDLSTLNSDSSVLSNLSLPAIDEVADNRRLLCACVAATPIATPICACAVVVVVTVVEPASNRATFGRGGSASFPLPPFLFTASCVMFILI